MGALGYVIKGLGVSYWVPFKGLLRKVTPRVL